MELTKLEKNKALVLKAFETSLWESGWPRMSWLLTEFDPSERTALDQFLGTAKVGPFGQ